MSFDRVAPFYRTLERLVFGNQLQQARVAFVRDIEGPRRVLIVGEGDGRFLAEFVRVHPDAKIDSLDASARMIALAQPRLGAGARVNFIQADLRKFPLEEDCYDLIVTHFFLDCFSPETLAAIVAKLARSGTSDAHWLVADFWQPEKKGGSCLVGRLLLAVMYFFFRLVAGIEADRLVDYRPLLRGQGFSLLRTILSPNETIRSEHWRRISPSG